MRALFVACIVLCVCSACVPRPTPTPVSTPVPTPTVVPPSPGVLPSPASNHYAPASVPACQEVQALETPVQFSWAGIEDIVQNAPEANWTYYRCAGSPAALAAFYRQWMPEAQYRWAEERSEQQPAGTMAAYFTNTGNPADPNRWLYLWFLPDPSSERTSYLVMAWWIAPKTC